MEWLSFSDFKKCFLEGHQIDIVYNNKYYQIFVGDYYIDYEVYSNENYGTGDVFYGHWTFKPNNFTTFNDMVIEFLDYPSLDGKSINEVEEKIICTYNTAGY